MSAASITERRGDEVDTRILDAVHEANCAALGHKWKEWTHLWFENGESQCEITRRCDRCDAERKR